MPGNEDQFRGVVVFFGFVNLLFLVNFMNLHVLRPPSAPGRWPLAALLEALRCGPRVVPTDAAPRGPTVNEAPRLGGPDKYSNVDVTELVWTQSETFDDHAEESGSDWWRGTYL